MAASFTVNNDLDAASINNALVKAVEAASQAGVNVAIAIVDSSGILAGFLRMPGSFLASVDYAQWKAWTAASFGMPTRDFGALLDTLDTQVRKGLAAHPNVTALPGGVPIRVNGRLIGALGVSGGDAEQDSAIAHAGASVFGV